jgi:TAG lipase / steryl ester hydrolase / phospholipase A2 / LPA acyltransferase
MLKNTEKEEYSSYCRTWIRCIKTSGWLVAFADKCYFQAASLVEYEKCTEELDMLQGHDVWKLQRESIEPGYNPAIIEKCLTQLQTAAKEGDLASMSHLLRTSLSRDLGGMSSLRLYKHSWFGTKYLIDDYINTVLVTVDRFLEVAALSNISTVEARHYQSSLEDALKFFGRSALTLSGGALFGMKHIGVVKALWEAELLPRIISGASAGSIVAAVVCGSTDNEMEQALEHFPNSDLAVFDTLGTTSFGWYKARVGTMLRTKSAFFEINNLERVMKSWLNDLTFREAHYKTGRVLNICVSSPDSGEARILNYITAPDVYIWSAVCASCSVPGVFLPTTIYEKDAVTKEQKVWMQNSQQVFVDGSLDHDIPTRKLSEMFNVNWFLVSILR